MTRSHHGAVTVRQAEAPANAQGRATVSEFEGRKARAAGAWGRRQDEVVPEVRTRGTLSTVGATGGL